MKYYFVFCKEDLLLEKKADGSYTIPYQEEPPTEVKAWTNILNICTDGTYHDQNIPLDRIPGTA